MKIACHTVKGLQTKEPAMKNQKSQESCQTALAFFQRGTKLLFSFLQSSCHASDKEGCFSTGNRFSESHETTSKLYPPPLNVPLKAQGLLYLQCHKKNAYYVQVSALFSVERVRFHKNKTFVLVQKKCFYSLQLDVSTLDQVEWYGACGGLFPCCCLQYAVNPNEQEVSGQSQSKIKLHLHQI